MIPHTDAGKALVEWASRAQPNQIDTWREHAVLIENEAIALGMGEVTAAFAADIQESEGAAPLDVDAVKKAIRYVTDTEPYDLSLVRECARLANDVATRLSEGAAPRAEGLPLTVAAVFQDHHPKGEARCECGWRPNLSPATNHHEHLMLTVLEVLGVRDE